MVERAQRHRLADLRRAAGLRARSWDRCCSIPALRSSSARQIEPADLGVLVDVAQDVGELQRAAEMVRERNAVVLRHAEHAHRQPSHRARHPVAVEVELCPVGRADVLGGVHVHAVDHGEEVLLAQLEVASPPAPAPRRSGGGLPGIDRLDALPPLGKLAACARHAARSNPPRRRPAGRTNRSRTSPRAARAAGSASRCRTSCPRRGSARRRLPFQLVCWRRSSAGDLLIASGAAAGLPETGGRTIPSRRRERPRPRPRACRGGHSRSTGPASAAI